jgi:hypothetical protein
VSRPRLSRFVEKPSYGLRKVYQGYPVPAASSPIFHLSSIGRDPPLRDMRRMRKEPSFNASTSSIIIGFCHFYSHGYSLIQFFSQLKRGFFPTLFPAEPIEPIERSVCSVGLYFLSSASNLQPLTIFSFNLLP